MASSQDVKTVWLWTSQDEAETQSHSCALLCPACPQPGINLPPNWENAPKEKKVVIMIITSTNALTFITLLNWLYSLFLALDGNFRMSQRGASSNE